MVGVPQGNLLGFMRLYVLFPIIQYGYFVLNSLKNNEHTDVNTFTQNFVENSIENFFNYSMTKTQIFLISMEL